MHAPWEIRIITRKEYDRLCKLYPRNFVEDLTKPASPLYAPLRLYEVFSICFTGINLRRFNQELVIYYLSDSQAWKRITFLRKMVQDCPIFLISNETGPVAQVAPIIKKLIENGGID